MRNHDSDNGASQPSKPLDPSEITGMRTYERPSITVSLKGPRNSPKDESLGVLLQHALEIVNSGMFKVRAPFLVRSILRQGLEQIIRDGSFAIGPSARKRVPGFRVTFSRN